MLPLRRTVESKRAAARPKDKAILHALEDARALIDNDETQIETAVTRSDT